MRVVFMMHFQLVLNLKNDPKFHFSWFCMKILKRCHKAGTYIYISSKQYVHFTYIQFRISISKTSEFKIFHDLYSVWRIRPSSPVVPMQAILNVKTAHCIITNVIRYQYSVLNIYLLHFLRYFLRFVVKRSRCSLPIYVMYRRTRSSFTPYNTE